MLRMEQAKADSGASVMGERQKTTKISDGQLLNDLTPLAAQWTALATQLGISAAKQHEIQGVKNRVQRCFQRVVEEWLGSEGPHTKAKLVETLKSNAMGNMNRLAKNISEDKDIPDNLDESSLGLLTRKLNDIAHKYSMFGTMLDISYADIAAIEKRVINVREYLRQMLGMWRERGGSPSDIIKAIRSPTIRYMTLAKKLEKEWTEKGFLPAADGGDDMPDGPPDIN